MKRFIYVAILSLTAVFFMMKKKHTLLPSSENEISSSVSPKVNQGNEQKSKKTQKSSSKMESAHEAMRELSFKEKKDIFDAVIILSTPAGLEGFNRNEAIQNLGKYGDRALNLMCEEIVRDNFSGEDEEIKKRIAILDVLKSAAGRKPFIVDRLLNYSVSEIDGSKISALQHMDLVDRLEAFEIVSMKRKDDAINHIRNLPEGDLRNEYSRRYVTGRRFEGVPEADAIGEVSSSISKREKSKG